MSRKINLLAIGNSFSRNALFFLHDICSANDFDIKIYNLYIAGCSLERHWNNIENATELYELDEDGVYTGEQMDIKQAIMSRKWDIITLQQASRLSGILQSFFPYITDIVEFIRKHSAAKLVLHKTWAYEAGFTAPAFATYDYDRYKMHSAICAAFDEVSRVTGFPVIEAGNTIADLRELPEFNPAEGGRALSRDGFHLEDIYGRYAAALTWYKFLSKKDTLSQLYCPDGSDEKLIRLIADTVYRKAK